MRIIRPGFQSRDLHQKDIVIAAKFIIRQYYACLYFYGGIQILLNFYEIRKLVWIIQFFTLNSCEISKIQKVYIFHTFPFLRHIFSFLVLPTSRFRPFFVQL